MEKSLKLEFDCYYSKIVLICYGMEPSECEYDPPYLWAFHDPPITPPSDAAVASSDRWPLVFH